MMCILALRRRPMVLYGRHTVACAHADVPLLVDQLLDFRCIQMRYVRTSIFDAEQFGQLSWGDKQHLQHLILQFLLEIAPNDLHHLRFMSMFRSLCACLDGQEIILSTKIPADSISGLSLDDTELEKLKKSQFLLVNRLTPRYRIKEFWGTY